MTDFSKDDPNGTISSPESQNLSTAELLATQYMMTGSKEEKELLDGLIGDLQMQFVAVRSKASRKP